LFDAVTLAVTDAALTVSVAALDVAVCVPPQVLVKTARYCVPLIATVGALMVYVALVAPPMLTKPLPVFCCHCTVGDGLPLAAAVKLAAVP